MTFCKLCKEEIESDFYEHIRKQHLTLGAKLVYRNLPATNNQKQIMLLKIYEGLLK